MVLTILAEQKLVCVKYKKYMKSNSQNLFRLLEKVKENLGDIPENIVKVFLNSPRHLFVDKFFDENELGELIEINITEKNLDLYLDKIYEDNSLGLAIDPEGKIYTSTISQPTIVLNMLKKMQIEEGQTILETGTASGWNAVMMSKLTGDKGHVYSVELISDLVVRARKKIKIQNIKNVSIIEGDGAFGVKSKLFDRIMFTVGSYDIPNDIYSQLKENGLLLMVLKIQGFFDCLILLKKLGNHLESISNSACRFVPLAGQYAMNELDPVKLESLDIWQKLKLEVVHEQEFWWGINTTSNRDAMLKISGVVSFLAIVEPEFKMFNVEEDTNFFGLIAEKEKSIVLWRNNKLTGYGNRKALSKIRASFELYLELGMPSANCFNLKVYPVNHEIKLGKNQWLVKRRDSQFVWFLK